jgi:hypothetical protein
MKPQLPSEYKEYAIFMDELTKVYLNNSAESYEKWINSKYCMFTLKEEIGYHEATTI